MCHAREACFAAEVTHPDELVALAGVVERLHGRFPQAPTDGIEQAVVEVHHQYDASRVRDFIPVLVEREVAERFRDHSSRA